MPWDLDLTLGQPSYNDNERADLWLLYRSLLISQPALVPVFRERLVARWQTLRTGVLETSAILARLAALRAAIGDDAIARNWAIWDIAQVAAPGFPLYAVTSAADEYDKVAAFLTARLAWIDANIAAY